MPATQRAIFFRGSPAEELSYKAKKSAGFHPTDFSIVYLAIILITNST
jgi:hypothetical protein